MTKDQQFVTFVVGQLAGIERNDLTTAERKIADRCVATGYAHWGEEESLFASSATGGKVTRHRLKVGKKPNPR